MSMTREERIIITISLVVISVLFALIAHVTFSYYNSPLILISLFIIGVSVQIIMFTWIDKGGA